MVIFTVNSIRRLSRQIAKYLDEERNKGITKKLNRMQKTLMRHMPPREDRYTEKTLAKITQDIAEVDSKINLITSYLADDRRALHADVKKIKKRLEELSSVVSGPRC